MADLKPPDRLQWFAAIDAAAKAAADTEKALKAIKTATYDAIIEALDAMGLHRAPLQGGPTIYRARELWAGYDYPDGATPEEKAAIRARAHEAMREVGLDEFIEEGTNSQTVSGYFRREEERLEEEIRERDGLPPGTPVSVDPDELLPVELAGLVKLTEKIYPKAVKS